MTNLIIFLAATITLNLTPGPDMLYVITRSIGQGRKAGIISSLGISTGCLVHTMLTAFGLSALLASSAEAFNVVKLLGAAYLLYLGIRTLFQKESFQTQAAQDPGSLWRVFCQGIITNVFNPKVALFFLAFLPQFVDNSKGNMAWQIILLGSIFIVSGTVWNSIVALLAGYVNNQVKNRPGFWRLQQWFTGGVFIALGARLAFMNRN